MVGHPIQQPTIARKLQVPITMGLFSLLVVILILVLLELVGLRSQIQVHFSP